MLVPFEEYIDRANAAKTDDELVSVLLDTVGRHGYDRMTFCLLNDHAHVGLDAGVHHLSNYPKDWMEYYFSQDFGSIDAVIQYCFRSGGTFAWSEIEQNMAITKAQKNIFNLGEDAKIYNGVCAPLWGGRNCAGIGLASTERVDANDSNLDLLTAYCNHFYLAFQRLHRNGAKQYEDVTLTVKEREVLLWVARGKTDPEIGDIMGISDHGVGFHLRNVYKKLEANSRILAVTKAITLGLIVP